MLEALDLFGLPDKSLESSSDQDVLRFANHLISICENQGWDCQLTEGPELWKETMIQEKGWVNPTFDPNKSLVDKTNSASVVIRDRKGAFVACNALRLFVADNFREVIATGELFYGPSMRLLNGLEVILPEEFRRISGRIGYSGGTLVSPRQRGKRMGLMLTRFVRILGERLYSADHHTGHIFQNRLGDPQPRTPYHFARCIPCLPNLMIPDRQQDQLLFLVHITQAEFLAQARRNVRKLVGEGDKTLNDLTLLAP